MNPLIPSAKTIQIYLPKGNPRGLRLAEMTTRTVRLIEIPRIHIDDFFAMPDANQVGLYFLIGDTDSIDKPLLYIGQTGDLKARLNQHYKKAYELMREGMTLRSQAWELEQIESNLLTSGNIAQAKEFRAQINLEHSKATQKLNEASMQADVAMDALVALAQQDKVKIPELYLLSPGSARPQPR